MKKILLVRHGETFQNRNRVVQGMHPNQGRLTEKGFRQAELLGEALVDHPIDIVFCSPLERAVLTMAKILNPRKGELTLPIVFSDDLKEINLGVLQGKPHTVWHAQNPDRAVDFIPEGGESWLDVQRRSSAYYQKQILTREHKNILIVAHGGVNRGILSDVLGLSMAQCWEGRGVGTPQDNTCINVLEYGTPETNGDGALTRAHINDTSHLMGHFEEASAGQLWQMKEQSWQVLDSNGGRGDWLGSSGGHSG